MEFHCGIIPQSGATLTHSGNARKAGGLVVRRPAYGLLMEPFQTFDVIPCVYFDRSLEHEGFVQAASVLVLSRWAKTARSVLPVSLVPYVHNLETCN